MAQVLNPPVWSFDEYALPCKCCSPAAAMENGLWICSSAHKLWYVDDKPDLTQPHPMEVCDGSCSNPLHRGSYLIIARCLLVGMELADALDLAEAVELASMTPKARKALEEKEKVRLAALAKEEAEEARIAPMLALHNAQMDVMHRHAVSSRYKGNVGRKECAPCRSLYTWQRDRKCCGTNHISSECWSHEFVDGLTTEFINEATGSLLPLAGKYGIQKAVNNKEASIVRKNGKFVLLWTPHNCWMLHPGEQGWLKEWEQNRKFSARPALPPNRFAALHSDAPYKRPAQTAPKPAPKPAPKSAPKPAPKPAPKSNNIFSALDSDDE